MNSVYQKTCGALACIFLACCVAVAEESSNATYESMFGEKAAAAKKTPSFRDDAELATRLWKATGDLDDSPKLQAYLCERTAEFAQSGKDYTLAWDALERLETLWPETNLSREKLQVARKLYSHARRNAKRDAALTLLDQLLAVGAIDFEQQEYAKARESYSEALRLAKPLRLSSTDDIRQNALLAKEEDTREKLLQSLKAHLKTNPTHAATAKRLVMIYLLERDDPKSALPYLQSAALDKTFQKNTLLAATKDIPLQANYTLGFWYRELAKTPSPPTTTTNTDLQELIQRAALQRAQFYLTRFIGLIEKGKKGNPDLPKAKIALGLLETDLRERALQPGKSIDLMLFVDLKDKKNRRNGTWTQKGDAIHVKHKPHSRYSLASHPSLLAIPVYPKGNFILSFDVTLGKSPSTSSTRALTYETFAIFPVETYMGSLSARARPMTEYEKQRRATKPRLITRPTHRGRKLTSRPFRVGSSTASKLDHTPLVLEAGETYRVEIAVRYSSTQRVQIAMRIDGRNAATFSGAFDRIQKNYSPRTSFREKCIHLACTTREDMAFRNIRLRMTAGKAVPLDE